MLLLNTTVKMRFITAACTFSIMTLAAAQIIPLDGVNFTVSDYSTHDTSQQAGGGAFYIAMNDTVAGNITIPSFRARCEWSFGPGNFEIITDYITGERLRNIVECTLETPNHHIIVSTVGLASEVSYYFYSPERYVASIPPVLKSRPFF